jgi:DNA-binding transcriptional ArsR family regulator
MTTTEESIYDLVSHDPVSAIDLAERHGRYHNAQTTFSRALTKLYQQGKLDRKWDGNERFGRYLYFRKPA